MVESTDITEKQPEITPQNEPQDQAVPQDHQAEPTPQVPSPVQAPQQIKPVSAPMPNPAVSSAPAAHPQASSLYQTAVAMTGGQRYRTSFNPSSGEVVREPVRMSGKEIGLALALHALSGALAGGAAKGTNAIGQAGALGLEQGQKIQQAKRQQDQDEQAAANTQYAQHAATIETNMRMAQNAMTLGGMDYDMHQKYVTNYSPMYEMAKKIPGVLLADNVNEKDLQKYHIAKDSAIPVGVVERLDADGNPVLGKNGQKQYDNTYAVVDPQAMIELPKEVKDFLKDHHVPGYDKELPEGNKQRMQLWLNGMSIAQSIQLAEQNLDDAVGSVSGESQSLWSMFPTNESLADAITKHEGSKPTDRNMRNNNPGNLKMQGTAGRDEQGFAKFNTMDEGKRALMKDIAAKQARMPNATPEDWAHIYSPDSAKENGPGTEKIYADYLRKEAGVPANEERQPLDLKKAIAADPSLIHTLQIFSKYSDKPIDEALDLMRRDPQATASDVGKIVNLVGGADAIHKIAEQRKTNDELIKRRADAQTKLEQESQDRANKLTEQTKDDDELAHSLASGDLAALDEVVSMRSDRRAHIYNLTKELNPNWNVEQAHQRKEVISDFTTDKGKSSQQIKSFNTLFDHIGDLIDQSEQYRRSDRSDLLNKPLNWWAQHAKNDPLYQEWLGALEPVKTEFLTFLQNNHALTDQDRQTGDILASKTMTPSQLEGLMKQFGRTAALRLKETDKQWGRVFDGSHFPGIISDDAVNAVRKINDPVLTHIVKDMDTGGFVSGSASGKGTPGKRVGDILGEGNANPNSAGLLPGQRQGEIPVKDGKGNVVGFTMPGKTGMRPVTGQ